jgi:hypothetical protein
MPEKYLLMLKVHYRMPDRTITPSQLAEAVGYPNHRAASMQYGRLAQLIGQTINFPPPKKWIDILVKPYIHHGDDYGWIMHDQVAQALEYLNLT